MKCKPLLYLLLFLFSVTAFSQNGDPELVMNLLTSDQIAKVNLDEEKFINSISKVTDYCKTNFKVLPQTQKIGLLLTVHKIGNPTWKCYSNPKIPTEFETRILKELSGIELVNTKLVDYSLFISINSKNEGKITDFEDYIDPLQQKIMDYEKADLKKKLALNKEFAINDVLPILAAYQVIVEDKFAGVKGFGKLLESTNFNQSQNIQNITSQNKNYWRATMEMEVGNQLIPISKIFALVSQGELDHAKKYIEIIRIFSKPKSISDDYLKEINYRIELFEDELNKEIEKGIVEHDKGNYQKAIDIYNEILKNYPNSSWTLYEKYFSENAKNLADEKITKDNREDWDKAKIEIYKHNPLYNMDVRASNGKEAYLMFRRQEIGTLFKNKDERIKDIYKYAEIATDLGVYDFAAQLFWLTVNFNKDNTLHPLDNYLYCLDKLGEKELKENFKGNFEKTFKKIDDQKEKEMKENSIYKNMKN